MKGAIFIALNEMIVEQHDLATWFDIIDAAGASGSYTSGETYAVQELLDIVGVICAKLKVELPDILKAFGTYLFDYLHKSHPVFADQQPSFFEFIQSIDGVIHVEVHKLNADALTPKISVEQVNNDEAILSYYSPRKLCHLAEGLLTGAAKHYGIEITISQSQCMHQGAEDCHLHLQRER
jgi:predicted hydrocarbon binding protein